uniref:Uncharacterized protein n=1 Tax=Ixodes ricinus TaxID=34613 RepID=A0A6B0UDJ2_IXORI
MSFNHFPADFGGELDVARPRHGVKSWCRATPVYPPNSAGKCTDRRMDVRSCGVSLKSIPCFEFYGGKRSFQFLVLVGDTSVVSHYARCHIKKKGKFCVLFVRCAK